MGLRGFLDNARREASSMAQGLFPAAQAIGQQTVNDLDRAIFTKGMGAPPRSTSFGLDNLGKMAAKGWYNDSPIVPLLSLDLNEAGSRFYDRPISGTFDFIGAGSVAGQGLKLGSKIPGSLGESALRARGYQKADISSLGMGTTVGEMPTRFKMADGSDALGREYLMRMQDQTHDGNLWLRKTMRSAKPSADTVFNEAVDTAETLADDPLTLQATPRARYEGFARVGDKLNSITPPKTNNPALDWLSEATFGPQVGSRRFGKRLIIRNQSRLKTSINEMMGLRGVMKKQIEKQYGKDADQIVGDATFLEAAGFRSSGDLGAIEEAFAPSGRKAVLDGDRVDLQSGSLDAIQKRMDELQSEYDALPYRDEHKAQRVARGQDKWTDEERRNMDRGNEIGDEMVALHKKKKKAKAGNVVELNRAELNLAERTVKQRDIMLEELAKDIEEFNNKGYEAVLTGGEAQVVLTPDSVRRGGDALAYALPNRNLHVRRAGDPAPDPMVVKDIDDIDNLDMPDQPVRGEARRGSDEEISAAREEAFGKSKKDPFGATDPDPVDRFAEPSKRHDIAEFQRQLRAKTSENYGQMAWYKNYLDQMVKARVNDGPDITYKFKSLAKNQQVRDMLDDEFFQTEILPKHKTLVAAQLEADKVRLGANALNQDNVVRNTDRLAMLFGKDGQGSFFVARPKYGDPKGTKRVKGDSDIEVLDENLPGDPQELIAKGILDTSPEVHLKNYLVSKNDASKQELADSVADASVSIGSAQQKSYIDEGMAVTEEGFRKGAGETPYVIVEPNGDLYKRIEEMQPLANQAARRLKEDGYHDEAANIQQTAREAFEATGDGDFSLGDMIRNPKLRGEIDDTRYMIPREMYEAIRKETDDSTSALSSFLQLSATGFKVSVLHGRWPAWVLNNTIGAQLYLALTGGTGRMIPHAGAGQMVRDYFPDVVGAGSKEVASGADDLGRVAQTNVDKLLATKPGKVGKRVVDTLGDWNQKIADEPARLARLEQVVEERFQSTVRLAKARGIEIPDTLESRRKMLQDQTVREDIAAEVLDDMIDFTTLSRFERKWVSNVIPFWTFIKGSTKSTYRTMSDHPGRVWPIQELGSFGADLTDQEYEGGSPEYLRALLPVANGKALSVGGWNPYSQQSALLSLGTQALSGNMPTGQEHPFSMVNPAITVPMEAINKRDTYTQYPLKGNMLQILGSGAMESMPLFENLKNIAVPQERSGREVFPPSRTNAMLNFAGIPIRNVDESNMNVRMQTDENRRKKNGTYDYWRFHNGV